MVPGALLLQQTVLLLLLAAQLPIHEVPLWDVVRRQLAVRLLIQDAEPRQLRHSFRRPPAEQAWRAGRCSLSLQSFQAELEGSGIAALAAVPWAEPHCLLLQLPLLRLKDQVMNLQVAEVPKAHAPAGWNRLPANTLPLPL